MNRSFSKNIVIVLISVVIFFINTGYAVYVAATFESDDSVKIMLDIEDKNRYDDFFKKIEEKNKDIKITPIYGKDLSTLIGTVDEPDIIKTGNVQLEAMKKQLMPLDIKPDFLSRDYYDAIAKSMIIDEKVYALPTSVNVSLLYYNKDIFDKCEEELRKALNLKNDESVYPSSNWTHDDFVKAGKTLTKKQGNIYTQWGCETIIDWWGEWMIYLRQFNGSLYREENGIRVSNLDSEEALKATQFMYDKCMGENKFAPATREIDIVNFTSGNVGMIIGGHTGLWGSYNALNMNWDIAVLPVPKENPQAKGGEISCDCFGIYANSKNKDKALRVLNQWTSKESALEQYKYGKISARKDVKDEILSIPKEERKAPRSMEALFEAIEKSQPLPQDKDFEQVMKMAVMDKITIMLSGGYGPEQAMKEAKRSVDRYYKNRA